MPPKWQRQRLRQVVQRIGTKYLALNAACDCEFNGKLFGLVGAERLNGRHVGQVNMFLPMGPFVGKLMFTFPAGIPHWEEIQDEEKLFRGARLVPTDLAGGVKQKR